YEVSAQIRLEAEIEQPGEVLVQGRMLSDIVRALPNKDVTVALEGTKLQVRCGSARFALATLPVEEYPQLPPCPRSPAPSRPTCSPRRSRRSPSRPRRTTPSRC